MNEFLDLLDKEGEFETREYGDFRAYLGEVGYEGGSFTVIHFNIRSINKNFEEFTIYLEELKNHVDVIILSETWNIELVSDFSIPGYSTYYNNSKVNQNDGLLVYIRDYISANVDIIPITETNLIQISMVIDDIKIGITASYRLPSINTQNYINDLSKYMSDLEKNCVDIFMGDINIDLMDERSGCVSEYLNILAESGYFSYINKPTRVTSISKSIIDHIFVRKHNVHQNFQLTSALLLTDLTDHHRVCLRLSGGIKSHHKNEPNLFEKNIINFNKLIISLRAEKWEEVWNNKETQSCYNKFVEILKTHLKAVSYSHASECKKIKPWITTGLITSIRHRDRLKKKLLNG